MYCLWWMWTEIETPPPPFESISVLYITHIFTSSIQELIMQGIQKIGESCFRCEMNTWYVESNFILQLPKYLIIVVNQFRYISNSFTKHRCYIPIDMTVVLSLHKFNLQTTIDKYVPSMYSCHYTTTINCCKKNILLQRQQHYKVWNDWYQKPLYWLCGSVEIDNVMVLGLEQENGSFNSSHGAGTSSPSH